MHKRSHNLQRQLLLSFSYQPLSMLLALMAVPIAISYLGKEGYGIWVTIMSAAAWLPSFDFGLGHGMKNRVAEALAMNDHELSRIYVSTNYFLTAGVLITMLILILMSSFLIDLQWLFNIKTISSTALRSSLLTASGLIAVNILLSLVNSIAAAKQKGALNDLSQLLMNCIWVPGLYVLHVFDHGNLLHLIILNGAAAITANLIVSFIFFRRFPFLLPTPNHIRLNKVKDIFTLGTKFFLIQFAAVIIFSTDNMIITQVLGPSYVAEYSVVYRLFGIITIGYSILSSNLWPAYTDAFVQRDFAWIRKTLRSVKLLIIPIAIAVFVLVLTARPIIDLWIAPDFNISFTLVSFMGIYILIYIWNLIHGHFLNGIGVINAFVVASLIAAAVNIPLSILLSKSLGLGSAGVILGTIVSLMIISVVSWIQTRRILQAPSMHYH